MMLAAGVIGGLLAGLLGVGGGIVLVPVLDVALGVLGVDASVRMHVAVATSLATIIPTSLSSSRAHHRRGAVDYAIVRRWGVPVVAGSVAGTCLAARVDGAALAAVFGTVALLVAVKMLLPLDDRVFARDIPRQPLALAIPLALGTVSSLMGIGGGTLGVPTFSLLGQPIHRAVGTAAVFGLLISLPAAIGYVVAGWRAGALPPGSVGYVNLIGLALIAPVTVLVAPAGARLAHGLGRRALGTVFGAFLLLVAVRMLYRAAQAYAA
ncbi:MAG: sulfite exporter TauE/SafE family protein [Gammaproteobacteria bacterium]|nr:sulfite exporter TauE/SafE family protein [Gammaproteobacteria bacterium]